MSPLGLKEFGVATGCKTHHLELIGVFVDDLNGLGANRSGGSKDYDSAHLPILPCTAAL
jgi:hypothetical protein